MWYDFVLTSSTGLRRAASSLECPPAKQSRDAPSLRLHVGLQYGRRRRARNVIWFGRNLLSATLAATNSGSYHALT
jgi:hypothetical protein